MTQLLLTRSLRSALAAAALSAVGASSFAASDVTITQAWARPTVPGQPVGVVYFDLRSEHGATLTGLRSNAAASVQLHSMRRDGDIMRMRELATLALPPGQTVHMTPGGMHAMLMQLNRPLRAGETLDLELSMTNTKGSRETMHVKVPVTATQPQEAAR